MSKFDLFAEKKKSVKEKANDTEYRLAKKLGGRRQPCSGALSGQKGDVKTKLFLIDSKETEGLSFSLKKEDLLKIEREANQQRRHPALVITMGKQEWACIPLEIFKKLTYGWEI